MFATGQAKTEKTVKLNLKFRVAVGTVLTLAIVATLHFVGWWTAPARVISKVLESVITHTPYALVAVSGILIVLMLGRAMARKKSIAPGPARGTSGVAELDDYPAPKCTEGPSAEAWFFLLAVVMFLVSSSWLLGKFGAGYLPDTPEWKTYKLYWIPLCSVLLTIMWGVILGWNSFVKTLDEWNALVLRDYFSGELRKLKSGTWLIKPWEVPTEDGIIFMGPNPLEVSETFVLQKFGSLKFRANVAWARSWKNIVDSIKIDEAYIKTRLTGAIKSFAASLIQPLELKDAQDSIPRIRMELERLFDNGKADIEKETASNVSQFQITELQADESTRKILEEELKGEALGKKAGHMKEQSGGDPEWVRLALADDRKVDIGEKKIKIVVEGADYDMGALMATIQAAAEAWGAKKGDNEGGGGGKKKST